MPPSRALSLSFDVAPAPQRPCDPHLARARPSRRARRRSSATASIAQSTSTAVARRRSVPPARLPTVFGRSVVTGSVCGRRRGTATGLWSQCAPSGSRSPRIPCRSAQRTACTRSVTPIVRKTLVRCVFTVFSLIPSRRAISLFGIPSSSSPSTSRSRGESPSSGSGAACASSSRRAARGRAASLRATAARMPCTTSSADASLSRYPTAPASRARRDPAAVGERGQHEHGGRRARARRMTRVASIPSRTGISRSMRTTSGARLTAELDRLGTVRRQRRRAPGPAARRSRGRARRGARRGRRR